jgi:hypothetical protein
MKRIINKTLMLTLLMIIALGYYSSNTNAMATDEVVKGVNNCPTEYVKVKDSTTAKFMNPDFPHQRNAASYSFSTSKGTYSGSLGLNLGMIAVSFSHGTSSGGTWSVKADQKKLSRVQMTEIGPIYRRTTSNCKITYEMKVQTELAIPVYYARFKNN